VNNRHSEWSSLRDYLTGIETNKESINNTFFKRLLVVLNDEYASLCDIFTAYRDALKASPYPEAELKFSSGDRKTAEDLRQSNSGLLYNEFSRTLRLDVQKSKLGLDQIDHVYSLEERRYIPSIPFDTTLASKLNPASPEGYYRGRGQQDAVRTALLSKPGSTIVINLPTGTGKTLVAHSLCLFSAPEQLTLVITPTTALAMEQSKRAKEMLQQAGEDTHNCYFFGSNLTPQQRQDIKERIRTGEQRILFTSPESARGALLPSLFDAAKDQKLANIIVDEAHIIDQWGDDFRPDFQIFGALTHALIKESQKTIKCLLLSATFTDTNLATLRNLFAFEGHDFIEVHSSFLRPEIQYQVKKADSEYAHRGLINEALKELPRPLIIYTLEREKAKQTERYIKSLGFNRIQSFTGETKPELRETIIQKWNNDELDIIVATSAFGVGMDKEDVRSILHIQPPENIDRFYQEVGRSGRDGLASQSLVLFKEEDFKIAKEINKSALIGIDKGRNRWESLFKNRQSAQDSSIVNITNMHAGIDKNSDTNELWNWRTLLLMQRAGMIEIEFKRPVKDPGWDPTITNSDFNLKESEFYDLYYQQVRIKTLVDDHRDETNWIKYVGYQRQLEQRNRSLGYQRLEAWLNAPEEVSLCSSLHEQYTINNYPPQLTCGGCPNCRANGRTSGYFPTLNFDPIVSKPDHYQSQSEKYIYYTKTHDTTVRKLIRNWIGWIEKIIVTNQIETIYSSPEIISRVQKTLPIGIKKFWANGYLSKNNPITITEPSLIIVPYDHKSLPMIDSDDIPFILLAPKDIPSVTHLGRCWWNDYSIAQSIDHYLSISN
jgi:ATP-dependent DNA helicase RecQ